MTLKVTIKKWHFYYGIVVLDLQQYTVASRRHWPAEGIKGAVAFSCSAEEIKVKALAGHKEIHKISLGTKV